MGFAHLGIRDAAVGARKSPAGRNQRGQGGLRGFGYAQHIAERDGDTETANELGKQQAAVMAKYGL